VEVWWGIVVAYALAFFRWFEACVFFGRVMGLGFDFFTFSG